MLQILPEAQDKDSSLTLNTNNFEKPWTVWKHVQAKTGLVGINKNWGTNLLFALPFNARTNTNCKKGLFFDQLMNKCSNTTLFILQTARSVQFLRVVLQNFMVVCTALILRKTLLHYAKLLLFGGDFFALSCLVYVIW